MRLVTAHKILIASAIALFAFLALFGMRNFAATGSVTDLATGVLGLGVAVGFGLYLRTVVVRGRQTPRQAR